jgi:hypothetical protein
LRHREAGPQLLSQLRLEFLTPDSFFWARKKATVNQRCGKLAAINVSQWVETWPNDKKL